MGLNTPYYDRSLDDLGKHAGEVVTHWNPRFFETENHINELPRDSLGDAFWRVARRLGEWDPAFNSEFQSKGYVVEGERMHIGRTYQGSSVILMLPSDRELVNRLYWTIVQAIDAAYRDGLSHGRGLLLQLSKGEIAPDAFDARSQAK